MSSERSSRCWTLAISDLLRFWIGEPGAPLARQATSRLRRQFQQPGRVPPENLRPVLGVDLGVLDHLLRSFRVEDRRARAEQDSGAADLVHQAPQAVPGSPD